MSAFGLDDNHSHTSGETVTSDSGRGGSESDIHSASLSNSHDSGMFNLPSLVAFLPLLFISISTGFIPSKFCINMNMISYSIFSSSAPF